MDLTSWTNSAMRHVSTALQADTSWREALESSRQTNHRVHLAVFVEPFLSYLLSGAKSVESRFSTRQCAPFRRVQADDIILLKAASGPVKGVCSVAKTWFYDLRAVPLEKLRARFAKSICATEDDFWVARRNAEYATLIAVKWVRALPDFTCPKRDRRGWVILRDEPAQKSLSVFS
jgi:hypothetical protein